MNAEMQLESLRSKAVWGSPIRLAVALAGALVLVSCGQVVRTGQGSSYLVLNGFVPGVVQSDVRRDSTNQVSEDPATANFTLVMKDLGGLAPTAVNFITITQYHVKFTRTDGRNKEGVDVPYAFDGAVTKTITGTGGDVTFTLVRVQAKLEAPLAALAPNTVPSTPAVPAPVSPSNAITTIATVTFYGHDGAGREASVSGSIQVTFANFPG